MKIKKFSKEWFKNKLYQAQKGTIGGYPLKRHATKGYVPDLKSINKKEQRINDIMKLAKEKKVNL